MSENTQKEKEQMAQEEMVQEVPQAEETAPAKEEEAAPAQEEKKSFLKRGNKDKAKIEELEKKVELMQLGDAFKASSEDVKEAKRKIGRIVREIDKCISMLND